MGESQPQFDRWSFRLLLAVVSVAAIWLLYASEWYLPPIVNTSFWNALVAFTLLGIASDSAFLPVPRISRRPRRIVRRVHPIPGVGASVSATMAHGHRGD